MGRARFWWPNLTTTVCRSSEVLPAAARALMLKCPLTRWGCSAGIRPGSAWPSPQSAPFSSFRLSLSLYSVHSLSPSLAYRLTRPSRLGLCSSYGSKASACCGAWRGERPAARGGGGRDDPVRDDSDAGLEAERIARKREYEAYSAAVCLYL